jgi:hypothetical protein
LLVQGVAPYQHAFIQKPPLVVYSYAFSQLLLPHTFWAPRLLAGLFVALATGLLGYLARLEFGQGAAWPAMWLVTPMVLLPGVEQFTANTEMFMLLPLLGAFAIHCYSRQHGHKPSHWLAAGFLGATALLYKYTALPLLVFLFAAWLVETWRTMKSPGHLNWCLGALLLGGIVAALLELGFFLVSDGGAALWECTVAFNRDYMASDNFGWAGLWSRLEQFSTVWWVLVLLAGMALLKPSRRLWFWIGAMVFAIVATGASRYGQYYIVMMPFWALLAAIGIRNLAELLGRYSTRPASQIQFFLLAITVVLVLLPDAPWLTISPNQFAAGKLARNSVFLESPVVARQVEQMTSPQDYVWVAASEPQILCYAHRRSPTRFITVYALTIPNSRLADYQNELIQEVQEHPPALIVWAESWLQETPRPSPALLFLNRTLAQDYQRVGGYVLAGKDSRWVEPLSDADAAASSVILYKHKPVSGEKSLGQTR